MEFEGLLRRVSEIWKFEFWCLESVEEFGFWVWKFEIEKARFLPLWYRIGLFLDINMEKCNYLCITCFFSHSYLCINCFSRTHNYLCISLLISIPALESLRITAAI